MDTPSSRAAAIPDDLLEGLLNEMQKQVYNARNAINGSPVVVDAHLLALHLKVDTLRSYILGKPDQVKSEKA
jgi:hypothetical protein